jgi:hypothetical protein
MHQLVKAPASLLENATGSQGSPAEHRREMPECHTLREEPKEDLPYDMHTNNPSCSITESRHPGPRQWWPDNNLGHTAAPSCMTSCGRQLPINTLKHIATVACSSTVPFVQHLQSRKPSCSCHVAARVRTFLHKAHWQDPTRERPRAAPACQSVPNCRGEFTLVLDTWRLLVAEPAAMRWVQEGRCQEVLHAAKV